jgi:hypothetical protein
MRTDLDFPEGIQVLLPVGLATVSGEKLAESFQERFESQP